MTKVLIADLRDGHELDLRSMQAVTGGWGFLGHVGSFGGHVIQTVAKGARLHQSIYVDPYVAIARKLKPRARIGNARGARRRDFRKRR